MIANFYAFVLLTSQENHSLPMRFASDERQLRGTSSDLTAPTRVTTRATSSPDVAAALPLRHNLLMRSSPCTTHARTLRVASGSWATVETSSSYTREHRQLVRVRASLPSVRLPDTHHHHQTPLSSPTCAKGTSRRVTWPPTSWGRTWVRDTRGRCWVATTRVVLGYLECVFKPEVVKILERPNLSF